MLTKATYCRICEAHCGLKVEVAANGALGKIYPDANHPISQGFVCAKGLKFLNVADHPDRLLHPLLRQPDGTYQQVSWESALDTFGQRIRPIIDQHGVDAVAFYFGTPMIHNALGTLTLFQWIRALGTRNVYSAGSQDNNSKLMAQKLIHGREWRMPIPDIAHADLFVLMGSNPVVSQSTLIHMAKGTVAYDEFVKRGGKMVIIDPRATESAKRWGSHIPIRTGTDIYLLLAILHALSDLQRTNDPPGMATLLSLAAQYRAERAADLTGIPAHQITELAHLIRETPRTTFFSGVGINQGPFGMLCQIAIQAIAYLTGNFDQEGGLLFSRWSVLLQTLVGVKSRPSRIGGYMSHAGGLPGGILADEILTPGAGQIKALIVVGGNPLTSVPDEDKLSKAFQSLDLLVSIDLFQNQTAELAHLILPGATWLERYDVAAWDMMYETAPMLQASARLRRPPADCRPEWRILADLSIASGKPLFKSRLLARLWARTDWDSLMPRLTKPLQWTFRRRLQGAEGLPWPQPKAGLYRRKLKRLRFWHESLDGEIERLAQFADSVQQSSAFVLLGRRRRLAQNSWVHNAGRDEKESESMAWLSAEDMQTLGLANGDRIAIRSEVGEIKITITAHDSLQHGLVVVPHGLPNVNVNRLISSAADYIEPVSGMHRMVGHRVSITKAEN